jgi:hypothetical protein
MDATATTSADTLHVSMSACAHAGCGLSPSGGHTTKADLPTGVGGVRRNGAARVFDNLQSENQSQALGRNLTNNNQNDHVDYTLSRDPRSKDASLKKTYERVQ